MFILQIINYLRANAHPEMLKRVSIDYLISVLIKKVLLLFSL